MDVLFTSQPELLPNPANMHIYRFRFGRWMPPNHVEELSSQKPDLVLDEKFQQAEFFQSELRLAVVYSNEIGIEIYVQSPVIENFLGFTVMPRMS